VEKVLEQTPHVAALIFIVTYFLKAMNEQRQANARMIGIFESNLQKQDSVYRDAMMKFGDAQTQIVSVLKSQNAELKAIANTTERNHEILRRLEKQIEDSDHKFAGAAA